MSQGSSSSTSTSTPTSPSRSTLESNTSNATGAEADSESLLTNGVPEPMQDVTDESKSTTALLNASSQQSSSLTGPLTSAGGFFPSQIPSINPFNPQVSDDDNDDGLPDADAVDQLEDFLPSDLDEEPNLLEAEEHSRLIRLNGDDGESSQGSSQDSLAGGEMPVAENGEPDLRRVKLYELVGSRWTDRGTAFCQGDFDHETEEARLIARAENTHEILLNCVVRVSDVYQRQQDTLIVWTEPDGTDFALSFQDVEGCNEVWDFITEVQKHLSGREDQFYPMMPSTAQQIIQSGHIPPPNSDPNLIAEIEKALRAMARSIKSRETICNYMQRERYIYQMLEAFEVAEREENLDALHALCSCMQTILLLNELTMYEHILHDDLWMGVVGVLEYDPEFPKFKANYRDFLRTKIRFMQPIMIEDPTIQRKIHHTYRLQYLKDVILGRALDDSTFNVLNTCIVFNQIEIINHIQQDEHFLRELVLLFVHPLPPTTGVSSTSSPKDSKATGESSLSDTTLEPSNTSNVDDRRKEVILLLQQLCAMGKNVQLAARINLFRTLVERGILYAVQWALTRPEKHLVFTAGEILTVLLEHGTVGIRNHVLVQAMALGQPTGQGDVQTTIGPIDPTKASPTPTNMVPPPFKETLAQVLCRMLANSQDFALQNLVADSLRLLADVPPAEPIAEQQAGAGPKLGNRPLRDDPSTERFLENFYKVCIETLLRPLSHDVPDHRELKESPFRPSREFGNLYLYLCDLLCSFATQHSFRSHFFVLSSNIDSRIASLLNVRDKHLSLAALRFFRICLKMNGRNLLQHLNKNDCFTPITQLTIREAKKDNLLSCACQEFFEFMRKENLRDPISNIMDKHEEAIRNLGRTALGATTFKHFVMRWEINKEPPPPPEPEKRPASQMSGLASVFPRLFAGAQSLRDSEAEDSYFNTEDDEEQIVPVPRADTFLGLFRRKRQRISAPGPHTLMNKGPQSHAQNQAQAQQRGERHIGITNPSSQQHLRPVSPLSSLLEYDDEEEIPSEDSSSSPSSSSGSQPTQIEILPYEGSSSDPEDDLLESLVSVSKSRTSNVSSDHKGGEDTGEGLLRPHGKKRRAMEEEEDAFERLAPKNRRLSFSVSSISELENFAPKADPEGDDDGDSTLAELGIGTRTREEASARLKGGKSSAESDTELKHGDNSAKSASGAGPKKLKLKLSASKSLLGSGKTSIPLGTDAKDGGNG